MGGTSTTQQQQTQQSTSAPWAAAQPALTGILGQLQGQLGNTGVTAGETNAINALTSPDQQARINQAYKLYQDQTQPLASNTNYDPTQTPGIQAALQQIQNDVTQNVNGMFAASGRDGSGYNQQTVARGIAQGEAPVLLGQYNQNVQNQQGAAGNLYGAAATNNGILSGLQQQGLQAELLRQGIPLQNLGILANIGVPIAGLGGTSSGTSTGTGSSTMSGAQQFATIMGGIGQLGNLRGRK